MQSPLTLHPLARPVLAGLGLWLTLGLAGCDLPGIDNSAQIEAKKMADGKAIGSGCRHAVRSIEECYQNNPKASKAAVFEGWRDMDGYMRDKNIEGMPGPSPEAKAEDTSAESKGKDGAKKH